MTDPSPSPDPGSAASTASPRPRKLDLAVSLVVLVVWLVPITEGAFNAAPGTWWPGLIRDFGSISCLFRQRPENLPYYRLQVRREFSDEWAELDEREFFPMEPFGHRSRFDRFMDRWAARSLKARDDLVVWISARDHQLRPQQPAIVEVRFIGGNRPIRVGQPPPLGHWQKPHIDPDRLKIDSIHLVGQPGRRP